MSDEFFTDHILEFNIGIGPRAQKFEADPWIMPTVIKLVLAG